MVQFNAIGQYAYSGAINVGETVTGFVPVSSDSLSCGDIQNALSTYQAATNDYPIDCDFVTLDGTGVVFFQDSVSMLLENSIEVSTIAASEGFDRETLEYIYVLEVSFMILLIFVSMVWRNIHKSFPKYH